MAMRIEDNIEAWTYIHPSSFHLITNLDNIPTLPSP